MSSRFPKLALALAGIALSLAHAQSQEADGFSSTTQDRLAQAAGWWPTKGDATRSQFVGGATCSGCHQETAALQATTPMYHAGMRAAQSEILKQNGKLKFHEGRFSYSLALASKEVVYTVSDGVKTADSVTGWAFGAGKNGQTYVLEKAGVDTESRLSYFTSLKSLDITPGHPAQAPKRLEDALGLKMDSQTARLCFGCHMTAAVTSNALEPEKAMAGVTCEACHGPGAKHVAAMKAGEYKQGAEAIMNPAGLSPFDSVDFCGACHRTWADVVAQMRPNLGVVSVRFQPYRLEESRCWGKGGDARITCIACHDPHQPLVRESSAYDSKCLSCHSAKPEPDGEMAAKTTCKVATSNCVSCHMPKYEVPDMHAKFTDHNIRVVRTSEFDR